MDLNGRIWIVVAGISGMLAVALGAYGAHGLDGDAVVKGQFDTANRYHMWHTLALLGAALGRLLGPELGLLDAGNDGLARHAKWTAWNELGDLSRDDAKEALRLMRVAMQQSAAHEALRSYRKRLELDMNREIQAQVDHFFVGIQTNVVHWQCHHTSIPVF